MPKNPPSWQPEYRRARWQEIKDEANAKRRERYAAEAELRQRRQQQAQTFKEKNPDYETQRSRQRKERSLIHRLRVALGYCQRCGYDRCLAALDWHHIDPATKTAKDLRKKPDEELWPELLGCLLICSNCHREAHAGLWDTRALAPEGVNHVLWRVRDAWDAGHQP